MTKVAFDVDGTLFDNKKDGLPRAAHYHQLVNPRPVVVKKLMEHASNGDHVMVWSREGKTHADNAVATLQIGKYVNQTSQKMPGLGVDLAYDDEPEEVSNMATKVIKV